MKETEKSCSCLIATLGALYFTPPLLGCQLLYNVHSCLPFGGVLTGVFHYIINCHKNHGWMSGKGCGKSHGTGEQPSEGRRLRGLPSDFQAGGKVALFPPPSPRNPPGFSPQKAGWRLCVQSRRTCSFQKLGTKESDGLLGGLPRKIRLSMVADTS